MFIRSYVEKWSKGERAELGCCNFIRKLEWRDEAEALTEGQHGRQPDELELCLKGFWYPHLTAYQLPAGLLRCIVLLVPCGVLISHSSKMLEAMENCKQRNMADWTCVLEDQFFFNFKWMCACM